MRLVVDAARWIRGFFGSEPRLPPNPIPELVQLQDHLSHSCGGGVIGCPCGGFVTPVVNRQPFGLEVAALACLACHEVHGLTENGLLAYDAQAPAPAATVL